MDQVTRGKEGDWLPSFLLRALALGSLFQLMRGGFTSSLLQYLPAQEGMFAYACYGIALIAVGGALFFYDDIFARFSRSKMGLLVCFALGLLGVFLPQGCGAISCVGMCALAVFAAWALAVLCDALSSYERKRALLCIALAFLFSFLYSFIVQAEGMVRTALLATIPIIVSLALLSARRKSIEKSTFFKKRPEIPARFLVTTIVLCVTGNFFTGLVDGSVSTSTYWSIYWSTATNTVIAIAFMATLKLGIGIQRILFWCWFLFSLAFFAGVVMLAIPYNGWISVGSDVITTFRVSMEFLLIAFIVMVSSREGLRADGLVGICFLLPAGCSVLLRHVLAPLIASLWDNAADCIPALVLLVTICILFSQYSFANKLSFKEYFSPTLVDSAKKRETAIDAVCRGKNLTPREREVLDLIAKGFTMKAISERLVISQETARTHGRSVYRKLDVHSKQEIIDRISQYEARDD